MSIRNAYTDPRRAESYAGLEFSGTYHLAVRDLPAILTEHVRGTRALDFGCGAGRSTRFLRSLGFQVVGVDVSPEMVARARERDPAGVYVLIEDGELAAFPARSCDLVLAAFPFDNIPGREHRATLVTRIGELLDEHGRLVMICSSPELYVHEWHSFTTVAYQENRRAGSGEVVRIAIDAVDDDRPIEDLLWLDEDYCELFRTAGLRVVRDYRPLGTEDDPYEWVTEREVAPWVIYVVERRGV
jgi:SAM-dependent methyltransferase